MDRMTYMNIAAIPDKMVTTTMMSVPPTAYPTRVLPVHPYSGWPDGHSESRKQ
jgi:hypothetical protein